MPVPTYDQFIDPLLRYLAAHPEGARTGEIQEALADEMGFSEEERQELLPSGAQAVYKNRIGWAHDRLKRRGLSESPKRGVWRLTPTGVEFVQKTTFPLAPEHLIQITTVSPDSTTHPESAEPIVTAQVPEMESPDERLNSAVQEINESVGAELLEQIMQASPKFFEFLVLDLLHAMGYGTSRADLQRVGGSGDAGIDGVISLDRLGLEKVYIQAKRWSNSVGRPDVQAFYGALAGQRATKGVFITTSSFTQQAVEFVQSVERIVLIDGARLTGLMIEHGVGG